MPPEERQPAKLAPRLTGDGDVVLSSGLYRDQPRNREAVLERLRQLLAAAVDYEEREEAPSLAGFLDRAALLSETDRLRDDVPVLLMTLHNAKGLEFPFVFIAGLEDGLFPLARSFVPK